MADPILPMITTVIPTYRRPQLLRRAIRSVLDQSYPHFRLCIYDNASGDETGELVARLASQDTRIHYHCHQQNIGAQSNFIYGYSRVRTPFLHLISDDDFLLPGFFAQAIGALEGKPLPRSFPAACYPRTSLGRLGAFFATERVLESLIGLQNCFACSRPIRAPGPVHYSGVRRWSAWVE